MRLTLFGIVVEVYRTSALTPKNVERLSSNVADDRYPLARKIARIKAARALDKRMGLKEAKAWVEQHFTE